MSGLVDELDFGSDFDQWFHAALERDRVAIGVVHATTGPSILFVTWEAIALREPAVELLDALALEHELVPSTRCPRGLAGLTVRVPRLHALDVAEAIYELARARALAGGVP